MNASNRLLSGIVAFRTYAKFLAHIGRRETLEETINRNMHMHLDRFPKLSRDIIKAYQRVHELKLVPSMRTLQFSGDAVLKNNARLYNCSYLPIDDIRAFGETLFLLLSGVGVGFSVQRKHVYSLPFVVKPSEEGVYVAHDSIVGWAQCVDQLFDAYMLGRIRPVFDLSKIRPKGSYLVTTGSKAPGPEPLRVMLEKVETKLKAAIGRKLKPIEVHDIICIISDSVLAGGIRRSALISLFDRNDNEMLSCKSGSWWEKYPERARANNSVVLPRNEVTQEEFYAIFEATRSSGSGEPGFSWTNNVDWGYNPCVTGDTEILTDKGYQRIDELTNIETNIWNGFEWSKVTPKITGKNQEIVTINFSNGNTLTCTKYHKFHIAKNYHGDFDVVEAKNLIPGMKLIKHKFPVITEGKNLEAAYLQGFHSAEGMDGYKFIYVYEPKLKCLDNRLRGFGGYVGKLDSYNRVRFAHGRDLLPKVFVPIDYNLKSKIDWLAGLFDGDGTELKEGGLQLGSIDKTFLLNVQKLLTTLGVSSKVKASTEAGSRMLPNGKGGLTSFECQQYYRLLVGAVQMQELKSLGLKCERMNFDKNPQRDASQFVTIVDIEDVGIAETVYCFNEPKNHTGIFNGVITGQCHEIALNPNQFCNLTSVNQTGVKDKKDFFNRIYAASLIGTLQASYTDFHYLRPKWRETTEKEALLGVSFTGIADNPNIDPDWLNEGAKLVLDVNKKYADKIGINLAARTTTIKPEGSSSCVLGSSSGIHARHSEYYLRRIRMNADDPLAVYLNNTVPELVEQDLFSSTGVVVTIPQESPKGALTRHQETAESLFFRAINYSHNWVNAGHRSGDNKHNVSVTISVKENEWDNLKELMWKHRDSYSGISLLPFDGGNYKQAPFEDCSKEIYDQYSKIVKEIDLKQVKEETDNTNRIEQIACAGGSCEIT